MAARSTARSPAPTPFSATLLTPDGKFHLLARSGETYTERPIEPKLDWPSYDGGYTGNRYSSLEQINTDQREAPGARLDFSRSRRAAAGSHSGRGGRRHVHHRRQ